MTVNPYRRGGDDTIPVLEGGTGATDAATARTNLGIGDLTAAAHAVLDHTGLPGIGSSIQAQFYDNVWTNSTAAWSTGALPFTPKFIIVNGIMSQLNNGANDAAFSGQLSSTFRGFAIGTGGSNAGFVSIQNHNTGDANDDGASFVAGFVGGNPAAGDVSGTAATTSAVRRLQVTSFSSGGITLSVSGGAFTARAFMLVVGQ